MCGQGRCSASLGQVVALSRTLVLLLVQSHTTQAKKFTVGDTSGWSFNVQGWTEGKKFKAGDSLGTRKMTSPSSYMLSNKQL